MSDYGSVSADAKKLIDRFTDLETDYQANQAYQDVKDDYDWTDEEKLQQYGIYTDQYRGEIHSWFTDLQDLFDDMADLPDPGPLKSAADDFAPALSALAGPYGHTDVAAGHEYGPAKDFAHLPEMDSKLHDWTGYAAGSFRSTYIPPLPRVVSNEFNCVVSLRGSLLASAEMWKKGREDVPKLIDAANAALNDYEGTRNPGEAGFLLAVVGAIIAVAAVPATGGTSVALYWAIAGATVSVAGAAVALPQEPKKELKLDGDSPAAIAQSLRMAIGDMKVQWIEDEGFIRDQLYKCSDTMNGYTAKNPDDKDAPPLPRYPYVGPGDRVYDKETTYEFTLPRPHLADVKPADMTGHDGFGYPDE